MYKPIIVFFLGLICAELNAQNHQSSVVLSIEDIYSQLIETSLQRNKIGEFSEVYPVSDSIYLQWYIAVAGEDTNVWVSLTSLQPNGLVQTRLCDADWDGKFDAGFMAIQELSTLKPRWLKKPMKRLPKKVSWNKTPFQQIFNLSPLQEIYPKTLLIISKE